MSNISVKITGDTTVDPISMIGYYSGVCYGSNVADEEKNWKRGLACIEENHGRTLEFPQVYSVIDGCSARVIREWYTHIGGMPTRLQASTRYINYENFDYYIPDKIKNDPKAVAIYQAEMKNINESSKTLLELGFEKEDVANLYPLGMTTKITDRRNMREIIEMSHTRLCTRAYSEFRALMDAYLKALSNYSYEWEYVVKHYCKPKCEILGYCNEKKSCGRMPKNDM